MAGGRSAARRALALAAFALLSAGALPAAAAPPSGDAAGPPVSASSLAATVTSLTAKVTQLESRASELDRQVVAASTVVDRLSSNVGVDARAASKLVAAAQRQALDLYVNGDPAKRTFALAAAVTQGDVNDVAWSLTLLQSTGTQTLKLAREARKRASAADAAFTEALSTRDRLTAERARLDGLLLNARQAVIDAEITLQDYVRRLGPGTIAGMTTVAYDAYRSAEDKVRAEQPKCGLRWELLAAIGKTESNHAQGRLAPNGDTNPPILGIPTGPDTDLGAIDGDPRVDHAVGPMQFIPSTWVRWGVDGNNDGVINISNIYDEGLAAGHYLCAAAGADTLFTRAGVIKAIWAYNPNEEYLRVVGGRFEALASDLAAGWFSAADLPTPTAPSDDPNRRPVADPQSEPVAATTAVRSFAPFTATGLAVPAVSADPLPALCGQSATMPSRGGVYRCQPVTVDPTQPAAAPTPAGAVLDPCVAAPYDAGLLACTTDPEQPVTLVRTGTPAGTALAAGPPYFLIVLEGGDRCRPVAATATTTSGDALATSPVSIANRALLPAQAATTTVAATTTTVARTTTTVATTTTTTIVAPGTTAPGTTASATTPTTAGPTTAPTEPTTTTTAAAPIGTLPPVTASASVYRCSSGAEITGQPVPGGVTATTPGQADATTTTVAGPAGSGPATSVAVTWTAAVTQAGVPARKVPVVTLIG